MEIYYYYDYYLHTLKLARKHQNALVRYAGGTYTKVSHGYSIFHLSELMDLELRLEINSNASKFDLDYPEFLRNVRTGSWK